MQFSNSSSKQVHHSYPPPYWCPPQKSYGCLGFLGDVFMTIITCGLWLIWIFVREMRR